MSILVDLDLVCSIKKSLISPSLAHISSQFFTRLLRTEHKRILDGQAGIKSQLEVYVPLRFSCKRPPVTASEERELDALMHALLDYQGARTTLGSLLGDDPSHTHAHSYSQPRGILLQGAAGTGKSMFGWRMMQYWDELPTAQQATLVIPIVITLPAVVDEIKAVVSAGNEQLAQQFVFNQLIKSYNAPGLGEALKGMSADQILSLYNERFVFILDGADELVDKVAMHKLLNMAAWPNSVFVVTSRTGFYSDDSEGVDLVSGASMRGLVRGIHLLSFGPDQADRYIETFAVKSQSVHAGWGAQQYRDALKQFPQLGDFLKEPLLLFLTLNVLPTLSVKSNVGVGGVGAAAAAAIGAQQQSTPSTTTSTTTKRLSRRFLQVSSKVTDDDSFPILKRAELYALFVHQWAEREAVKRGRVEGTGTERADPVFVKKVIEFCQRMAFEMFMHNKTQYVRGEGSAVSGGAHEGDDGDDDFDIDVQAKKEEASKADTFLDQMLSQSHEEFHCSPIKRSGAVLSFLHKTVQEYFVALQVVRELGIKRSKGEVFAKTLSLCELSSLSIGKKLLTTGNVYETLHFCADLVDKRGQWYVSGMLTPPSYLATYHNDETAASDAFYKSLQPSVKALWDIVQASRQPAARSHLSMAIAAANSMMVLNAAGFVFGGCDLSNATLGVVGDDWRSVVHADKDQRHFMDVSGGVFSSANLSGAVLSNARLDSCSFAGADLRRANLTGATFGQLPMLQGHEECVVSVCVAGDGKLVSGSHDKTVRVWSLESGECLRTLAGHTGSVKCVCVTGDGKHVVSGSTDKTVRVWALDSGECVRTLTGHTDNVRGVSVTRDGKYVVSGSADRTVKVWSLDSGECLRTLSGHTDCVLSVCVTADGKHVVSGSADKTLRVWLLDSGECVRTMIGHTLSVVSLCVTGDGKAVVSGSRDATIRVWSLESGECLRTLTGHRSCLTSVGLSDGGEGNRKAVSGSWDKTVRVWSLDSGECLSSLTGHADFVESVCVTTDGKHIVSGSQDTTIRMWSLDSGENLRNVSRHAGSIQGVCVTSKDEYVISAVGDCSLRVWSLITGEFLRTLTGHTDRVQSVCVTGDGKHVVSGSLDNTVRVWSLDSGKCVHTLTGHTRFVNHVLLACHDKHILSSSWDDTLRVWSLESGECLHIFKGRFGGEWSFCVTGDDKYVVSGSLTGIVRVFSLDMDNGTYVRALLGHTKAFQSVCVTRDDKHAITASEDTTLRVWSLDSGECERTLIGHTSRVYSVCLMSDDKYVVSGSTDLTVRVWSFDSGECLCILTGHRNHIRSVRVSHNGKYIISGSSDSTVGVWSLENAFDAHNKAERDPLHSHNHLHTPKLTVGDTDLQVVASCSSPFTPRLVHLLGSPALSFRDSACDGVLIESLKDRRLMQQLGGRGLPQQ